MIIRLGWLLSVYFLWACSSPPEPVFLTFETLAQTYGSYHSTASEHYAKTVPTITVITRPEDIKPLLNQVPDGLDIEAAIAEVDFAESFVLYVSGIRAADTGHTLSVTQIERVGNQVNVQVQKNLPEGFGLTVIASLHNLTEVKKGELRYGRIHFILKMDERTIGETWHSVP